MRPCHLGFDQTELKARYPISYGSCNLLLIVYAKRIFKFLYPLLQLAI
jgi:hypothetical protein